MMFIDELYQKSVAENNRNLQFWENYLKELKSLDFDTYAERLKVPILVPIGNKILFRGELQHTNEVTVSLGADYFVKCSIAQAEVLKQRRIKGAQSKVDLYRKEQEYLENRISFTKDNILEKEGQEIIEEYSPEEDKAWRKKHKENLKKYHQNKVKENIKPENEISDAELWERLEELELQEELENEMLENYNEIIDRRKENKFFEKEEALLRNSFKDEQNKQIKENISFKSKLDNNMNIKEKSNIIEKEKMITNTVNDISKHELLQKVLDKQNELQNKLHELKHKERIESKTEQDLIEKLDEMDQLDELEDEMDRLDDILEVEDVDTDISQEDDVNSSQSNSKKVEVSTNLKKKVLFADEENDAETLDITFSHSNMEPILEPYDAKKGITKPSDVYEAYMQVFENKPTSILKKSKYECREEVNKKETEQNKPSVKQNKKVSFETNTDYLENSGTEETAADNIIVIKDVVESVGVNQNKIEGGARPTSLFKKMRMQKKL